MKITIDTKEDSADDLKKVVKMLEALLEGHVAAPFNMFGDLNPSSGSSSTGSTQSPGADLFSIFGDDSKAKEAEQPKAEIKDDDVPEMIPY